MSSSIFSADDWYCALTLGERLASLRNVAAPAAFDESAGRRELERWRARTPFDRDAWFAKRLEADGLSEAELVRLLGEPIAQLRARTAEPPAWLREIEAAFVEPSRACVESLPLSDELRGLPTLGFLDWIEPLMRRGLESLRSEVGAMLARHRDAPFDARVVDLWFTALPWRLHTLIHRTLVLELNVARMRGQLAGDTSEQRYASFVIRLRDRDVALGLLAEYPVLARSVVDAIERWRSFGVELLEHACADWTSIRATFFAGRDPGRITALEAGAGDVHRGGRSVVVASFESGARLVYKPRSLSIERTFGELVDWVNARGSHPPLRRLNVLDRGDHGWVEFVGVEPCADLDALKRFYRRQGAWLALFFALEATDFHFENLIAAGEHPVPIDLEALFHARPPTGVIARSDYRMVADATASSVMRVGLLPSRTGASESAPGADISGFGGLPGQSTPERVLQWAAIGTDEMRAVREFVAMPGAKNLPAVAGRELRVLDHVGDVVAGFDEMYRTLVREREALLAPDGPLSRFAQVETRSVLRATRAYGMLQLESLHPDLQRDALEREHFLDGLWVGVDENEYLLPVVAAERAELLAGDVPLFTSRPGSRDLWTARGERIADFWPRTGLDQVRERMASFDERDLERQIWYVRASLATLALENDRLVWPTYRLQPQPRPERAALRERLLAAACDVGDQLDRLALRSGDELTWLGLAFASKRWDITPLLDDLYSGTPGVIHFLAHLAAVTGERRFATLARTAASSFLAHFDDVRRGTTAIGSFNGLGGLVYALSQWSELLDEPRWRASADVLLARIPELIDSDEDLDLVGGAAGCIVCMLALQARDPSRARLDLARLCGERLVARAQSFGDGAGWFSRIETDAPITGLSHGCAGIAWALSALFEATGDARYRDLALRAVAYERTRFVGEQGNWRDTPTVYTEGRPRDYGGETLSMAWCYGAPGIGLGRLMMLRHVDDAGVRDELRTALRGTLSNGFGRNHCLCHGDLGNLDFVLAAGEQLHDERLLESVDEIAATVLHSIDEHGWICGVPLGVESPALMNGLAGIGYGLLRLAAPERVPSVLALEPLR